MLHSETLHINVEIYAEVGTGRKSNFAKDYRGLTTADSEQI